MAGETDPAEDILSQESIVPLPQELPAPFASLSPSPAPRHRWSIAHLFTAPFYDVDDRAARLAAAAKRERELRQLAMSSDAGEPRD